MATGLILTGLGLAAVGFAGRYAVRYGRIATETLKKQLDALPAGANFSKYYKGGFETKMSRREAGLVLGIRDDVIFAKYLTLTEYTATHPAASNAKVKEAHKRIMLLNHPDRGGSPYLASKINEAKDYLDKARPGSK